MKLESKGLVLVLVVLWVGLSGCSTHESGSFNGDRVRVFSSDAAPGETPAFKTLVVKGKGTYKPLYSYEYAKIPEWDSIVFVTSKNEGQYVIHIVELGSGKEIVIETEDPIGSCLGIPDQCWLESVSGDTVTFVEKSWRKQMTFFTLDKSNRTISKRIQTEAVKPK
ncbi:MAG: hypothetical protein JWN25_2001 [Verrucomicrobiales bacterium]|nr:hypothetical protein [Verrucomicrobiales bacterium]MDB6130676.1 hypothetical protein [Verrucomicrobiales bacterium]